MQGLKTYILITEDEEYYCGKTVDLDRRIDEHKKGDGWFKDGYSTPPETKQRDIIDDIKK